MAWMKHMDRLARRVRYLSQFNLRTLPLLVTANACGLSGIVNFVRHRERVVREIRERGGACALGGSEFATSWLDRAWARYAPMEVQGTYWPTSADIWCKRVSRGVPGRSAIKECCILPATRRLLI